MSQKKIWHHQQRIMGKSQGEISVPQKEKGVNMEKSAISWRCFQNFPKVNS